MARGEIAAPAASHAADFPIERAELDEHAFFRVGLSHPLLTASPVSRARAPWTRRGKVRLSRPPENETFKLSSEKEIVDAGHASVMRQGAAHAEPHPYAMESVAALFFAIAFAGVGIVLLVAPSCSAVSWAKKHQGGGAEFFGESICAGSALNPAEAIVQEKRRVKRSEDGVGDPDKMWSSLAESEHEDADAA